MTASAQAAQKRKESAEARKTARVLLDIVAAIRRAEKPSLDPKLIEQIRRTLAGAG